jgi:Carbohydrate family 9 binding domain-like/Secretion system C-terminal sorting domain
MRKFYMLFFSLLFVAGATFAQKVNVDVMKTSTAPVIDGVEEEIWDAVDPVPFVLFLGTEVPTVTAYWKALWDDTNIYVFINVEDDNYYPGWEAGGNGWEYDKPEIYFDVNDVLNDGVGPATASSGHYQYSPDPTDGGQDAEHVTAGTTQAPGGSYCYTLVGESYAYEYRVEIGSLSNVGGTAMTSDLISSLPENVGFDATVIDQDEGVTTARQRTIWQSGDGTEPEAWNSMDNSGTITLKASAIRPVNTVNVSVAPNPVTDFLTINADFDKVVINNILGQEISTLNQVKTNKLDVSYLSKGIYIIKVYKGERYIGAAKITKN